MWLFYIIAIIPMLLGFFFWLFNKNITFAEWLAASIAGFVIAVFIHLIAVVGLTDDIETWSGQITQIQHYPSWIEKYRVAIYRTETYTTGSGKNRQTHTRRVFSHYETRHSTHPERWTADAYYGTFSETRTISVNDFNRIKIAFGNQIRTTGVQSTWHGGSKTTGDNNIYTVRNETSWIEPVTITKYFSNRIKATPSTFSFSPVPPDKKVYEWPTNPNWFTSNRLLNENRITTLAFDQMNSRLGMNKKVNVIMINFGNQDASIAEWQRAKFIGGKKNDLVLCYGQVGTNNLPQWAKCFGWTEREDCKRNLETILLTNPINNDILNLVETEIKQHYIIKDWTKFDYITIPPRPWCLPTYLIFLMGTQIGLWILFHNNLIRKD